MSRRAAAPARTILPDPKFNSEMLAKFMNVVMQDGKKSAAERILYGAIARISEKTGKQGGDALEVLSVALDNVKPAVEVKSRRVGGATYQVPVEVRSSRRQTLAMRWVIEERAGAPAETVFKTALNNAKPVLEVKSRRVGGATYQVPVEVRPERRQALAMRWLIQYSRARGEKTMEEKLAGEIMDAANNRGNAVKKREDTHKMAEANKAFAHYRW